jgi:hypothetical protein
VVQRHVMWRRVVPERSEAHRRNPLTAPVLTPRGTPFDSPCIKPDQISHQSTIRSQGSVFVGRLLII